MTNIITEIEGIFEPEVAEIETFANTVKTEVTTWVKAEAALAVDDAKVAWTAIGGVLTKIGPSQWVILQGLVATAQADVTDGDYGNLVTDVLNQAASKELAWVAGLGTALLTVILAALHLQKASA